MPTMFDSHDEFNEWFSKDIESQAAAAADKCRRKIDENQLSRLHLILKPFMLRRVKADVEHELSQKVGAKSHSHYRHSGEHFSFKNDLAAFQIEILVYCDLSRRQRLWYQHLKKKISWQELREAALTDGGSTNANNAAAKSLMNIMMQMRKICNHPDLMERRDVRFSCVAPLLAPLRWPKLVFREGWSHLPGGFLSL